MRLLTLAVIPLVTLCAVGKLGKEESRVNKLGNLSPYHGAPRRGGVKMQLPEDCKVDQVMLMGRHGSRYPTYELGLITSMTHTLAKAAEWIAHAHLPHELKFLKKTYNSTLGKDDLTPIGRRQLFEHGVDFRLKYPHLVPDKILAGDSDRVIESAQWFGQGYFGRSWPNISTTIFSIIPEDGKTMSWISPWTTCPKWGYDTANKEIAIWQGIFLPPITRRLRYIAPGLNFTDMDTLGALYACPYDYAAYEMSPWCDVFTKKELLDFAYYLDLGVTGVAGYNLPGQMGPVLGSLYVNELIERFSDTTSNAKPVYLEFGHDVTITLVLSALGLAKDIPPLTPEARPPRQKFFTANLVPFGAQMIWEKFTCSSSFRSPRIRLILNDSPLPLSICDADRHYGSCSFADFIQANAFSTSIKWRDAKWNATCGTADSGSPRLFSCQASADGC